MYVLLGPPHSKHLLSRFLCLFDNCNIVSTERIREAWHRELGIDLSDFFWERCLSVVQFCSVNSRHQLIQFKVTHNLHDSKHTIHYTWFSLLSHHCVIGVRGHSVSCLLVLTFTDRILGKNIWHTKGIQNNPSVRGRTCHLRLLRLFFELPCRCATVFDTGDNCCQKTHSKGMEILLLTFFPAMVDARHDLCYTDGDLGSWGQFHSKKFSTIWDPFLAYLNEVRGDWWLTWLLSHGPLVWDPRHNKASYAANSHVEMLNVSDVFFSFFCVWACSFVFYVCYIKKNTWIKRGMDSFHTVAILDFWGGTAGNKAGVIISINKGTWHWSTKQNGNIINGISVWCVQLLYFLPFIQDGCRVK